MQEQTKISIIDVIELLNIYLDSATLQWHGKIYMQNHGAPLRSQISVVLAELSMRHIESQFIQSLKPEINLKT